MNKIAICVTLEKWIAKIRVCTQSSYLKFVPENTVGLWNPKHKRKTLRKTSALEMTISSIKAIWQALAQIFLQFHDKIDQPNGKFDRQ